MNMITKRGSLSSKTGARATGLRLLALFSPREMAENLLLEFFS
jgi:hypothetical protein